MLKKEFIEKLSQKRIVLVGETKKNLILCKLKLNFNVWNRATGCR